MTIYTKNAVFQMDLEPWKKDAVKKFETKMQDKEKPFPCIPATQGHQLDHFRYGFLSPPDSPHSVKELAEVLEEYSKQYSLLGSHTSLVLFYEEAAGKFASVEEYEQVFWEQLSGITKIDKEEWPSHIPTDPENPLWEFCFHGKQYFMYCATPAHKNRMSRNFPYLMLAITPRSVLVEFNASKSRAAKIKSGIRKRLADYDTISIHPDLNSYGKEDNYEWKQYFLHDDDTTVSKCPFHKYLNTTDKAKSDKND